jgi:hypothetical protein
VINDPLAAAASQFRFRLPSGEFEPPRLVGAPGGSAGVTELDAADAEPVPIPLVAVTVKVYG